MLTTIPLTLKQEIPEKDYYKLASLCVPMSEGGMYRLKPDGSKEFDLHISHVRACNILMKNLGLPEISIQRNIKGREIVNPAGRSDMKITLKYVEGGLVVIDKTTPHFVPDSDLNIIWEILKQKAPIEPRQVWSALASRHALFPELDQIINYLKTGAEGINPLLRDSWVSALHQYRSGAFEGLRRKKKYQDENNYYSLYWFDILLFKRLGLIEQNGNKEIYFTDKGKETKDWKMCIVESR